MARKMNIGIVGAGGISRGAHVGGWKAHPEAKIVAIADLNIEAAKEVAADAEIPNAYADFKDLLKHKEIDIVDVCVPNRVHTPVVLAALNAGKHVVCEKPLAVSTAEVRKMGQLADRKRRKLMTAQHQRFSSMGVAAKNWVDAGNLGKPFYARVHALRRNWLPTNPGFIDSKLSGGGPCMDIGVHALDLCMHLMGCPKPVAVTGRATVNFAKGRRIPGGWGEWDRKRFDVEDWASGFVHFDTGATMVLEAAWLCHRPAGGEDLSCHIQGEKASVDWPTGTFHSVQNRTFVDGNIRAVEGLDRPHTEELHAFYAAVADNKPSPVPWQETLRVIGILEGIYKSSAKGGREVTLKL